jgi:hypothetical protein
MTLSFSQPTILRILVGVVFGILFWIGTKTSHIFVFKTVSVAFSPLVGFRLCLPGASPCDARIASGCCQMCCDVRSGHHPHGNDYIPR